MGPLYLRNDADVSGYSDTDRELFNMFSANGYVVVDLAVSDDLARRIIEDVAPLYNGGGRVQDAGLRGRSNAVLELASNETILDILQKLYGRAPFPFQTLNFPRGTEQLTHSDTVHFDSFPAGYMAGVWVALEDIDETNGPLHYYPGSHRLPQLTLADLGARPARSGYNTYESVYEPGIQNLITAHGLKKEEARIKKGHALIWAANLLHGGNPIIDLARSRHSQVTHYFFEDCTWSTPLYSEPALGRVKRRHPIDLRSGEFARQAYLGEQISPSLIARAKFWYDRMRRPHHRR